MRIVSLGSSPTLRFARDLAGVTEARPGVAMFGDLFQAGLGTHGMDDIALTVLATVIGRRPERHQLLLDAGALALSKDRSTANLGERAPGDCGFGLVVDEQGRASLGRAVIAQAYQEHGVVACDPALPFPALPVGARVRVLPNHACLTAAAHPAYHVIDEGRVSRALDARESLVGAEVQIGASWNRQRRRDEPKQKQGEPSVHDRLRYRTERDGKSFLAIGVHAPYTQAAADFSAGDSSRSVLRTFVAPILPK